MNNENELLSKAKSLADSATTIEQLKKALEEFAKLIEMGDGYHRIVKDKKLGKSTVFGEFNKNNATVMIIGEAPGEKEDEECEPFCGKSGDLLNEMLEKMGIKRTDLCITNTVFWRPCKNDNGKIGNRAPTVEETKICKPFLQKQIDLVNPKLIICLGKTSLIDIINDIQIFEYVNNGKKIKVIPKCHPSYLLRGFAKDIKAEVFEKDLPFIEGQIKNL